MKEQNLDGKLVVDAGACIILVALTAWVDTEWLTPRGQLPQCHEPLQDAVLEFLQCGPPEGRIACDGVCPLLDLAVLVPCFLTLCDSATLRYFTSRLKYVLLVRLLLMACTTLPPPGPGGAYATLVQGSHFQVGCSGHAAIVLLACVCLSSPATRGFWLGYAVAVAVGILAASCHYSLCVIVAWLLVFALCPLSSWPLLR